MRYLLDANAVIALLNDTTSRTAQRARREQPGDVAVSAFRSRRKTQNLALIDALQFLVLEFDKEDARQAGEVRAVLASKGTPIGPYDALIAGQAVARDMILVTHNTQEFGRVPRLRLEDWQE